MGVGDKEVIGRGSSPGCIHFHRVSDDRDDGDPGKGFEMTIKRVGIEGIGRDHEIRSECLQQFPKGILGFLEKGEGFGEVLSVG